MRYNVHTSIENSQWPRNRRPVRSNQLRGGGTRTDGDTGIQQGRRIRGGRGKGRWRCEKTGEVLKIGMSD